MSKILTRSLFYYGGEITRTSANLDFDEGGLEIQAVMDVGDYTMADLATEMARAMSEVGSLTYTGTFNRTTRKITIASTAPFTLRSNTGTRVGTSAWIMLGFSTAANHTGASTYTGDTGAAYAYQTQYPVSQYTAEEHSIVKESSTTNVSATGVTQQIYFAEGARIEMNIRLISDKTGISSCQSGFYENATGISDFMAFMRRIMHKGKLEFMKDVATPASFTKVILDSTKEDRSAQKFELKNMKTPDWYESGQLVFRKVIES